MKCPKCNGRGTVGYFHIDHFVDIECDRCNGSGEVSEVEMTNEEWFASLPTERKAHFFAERFGGSADRYNNIYDTMLEWLKEKHE